MFHEEVLSHDGNLPKTKFVVCDERELTDWPCKVHAISIVTAKDAGHYPGLKASGDMRFKPASFTDSSRRTACLEQFIEQKDIVALHLSLFARQQKHNSTKGLNHDH